MSEFRGDSIGWGPWRRDWYSICSHLGCPGRRDPGSRYSRDCPRCMAGYYVNRWAHRMGSFVFRVAPDVWRWWANR